MTDARPLAYVPAAEVTDLDELRRRIADLSAENTRLRDQQARRFREEKEHRERVEAACRRTWQEDRQASAALFIDGAVRNGLHGINALLYAVEVMPERPKRADLDRLRVNAEMARHVIKLHAEGSESATALDARMRAEVNRLREYVTRTGRALHDAHGESAEAREPGGLGCVCPGCMLIIGMDVGVTDVPA